jgi:hypothetical protein
MPVIATPVAVKHTIDPNCALTRHEFCALEGLSMYQYRKLLDLGFGPRERWLPGIDLPQITPQARAEWHKRMAGRTIQNRIKRDRKRRSGFCQRIAQLGMKSPKHPINKRRARRALSRAQT